MDDMAVAIGAAHDDVADHHAIATPMTCMLRMLH
jgi:hypothetical protein